ncbi:DMT family transporter [Actinopolyspora xinjiangensis]|uniref:DMT family transporter n=1 Tax=Actinopolyspora xinjiangensis TaxID=405564 RepID=UPI001FCCF70C|nr:DMT family transporter [Actinopolyspora xinjiangensis]
MSIETATVSADPDRRVLPRLLGSLGAAAVGFLLASQSRINGVLGAGLDDALAASVVSFGGGLVVLLVVTSVNTNARRGVGRLVRTVRSDGGLRPWQCLGGVCGAFLVFSQSVAANLLGVALFTVGAVGGQIASGLVVDRLGLGAGVVRHFTAHRVVGALLALGAVVVAVSARLGGADAGWLVLLPAVAGVGVAWQQAMNGLVKRTAGSAVSAATLNFGTGTTVLLAAFAVDSVLHGLPTEWPAAPWLYLGGPIGIFVVAGSAVLVHYTGVLLLSMGIVFGQLSGALLLDLVLPVAGSRVDLATGLGVCLALLAVAVASMGRGGVPARARSATIANRERHDSRR